MTNIVDRFLKYVSFDTQSDDSTGTTPSTKKQFRLAEYLVEELKSIGMAEVEMDELGYVYATLPANTDKAVPTIGFIAHMDTSPDASGENVRPRIVQNYDGTDIVLDAEAGIVTSVEKFPELLRHVGEDIIVTDGHTLLGADDKAGIAEIVTAMEYLIAHPEIKYGKVRVGFNPDEEIGLGAHKFDVERFGCEWAYTMDGSERGELEFENFNAASAKIDITGVSVHPGYAKDKMVNAARLATELVQKMPEFETPEHTTGYEGFFHLTGLSGSGKSSLAFDTLYAEGQRRYVESLSAYARQFLGRMNKPECDYIKGLPPAIAIEQKVTSRNPRSTVGTSTEIYEYLRLFFSREGKCISKFSYSSRVFGCQLNSNAMCGLEPALIT